MIDENEFNTHAIYKKSRCSPNITSVEENQCMYMPKTGGIYVQKITCMHKDRTIAKMKTSPIYKTKQYLVGLRHFIFAYHPGTRDDLNPCLFWRIGFGMNA